MIKTAKKAIECIKLNTADKTAIGLIWLPFLFALGIALYFAIPDEPNIYLVLGIFEGWLLLLFLFRHWQIRSLLVAGLVIISGFLNIYAHTMYQAQKVHFLERQMTYLSGFISDISYNAKGQQRLLLSHAQNFDEPLKGNFRITLTNPHEHFEIGQCVEMAATIFPPERIPVKNGFQLNRKYFYEGISGIGYANSEVFAIECEQKLSTFKSHINSWRQNIIQKINAVLAPAEAGVVNALLIGEKTLIAPQISDNYRGSGLAHFLAVSGLHMGAIAALVFFLVRFILALFPAVAIRSDSKNPAAVIAICCSTAYLLMSGMAVPAERAFIMTTVVLVGVLFNRQAISIRMVSVAAFVILLIQPQALISVSFQMSFAAVYALVAFYETYAAKIARYSQNGGILHKIWWYLLGILLGDLVASLATTPFSIYHFRQVAMYTSLGNLLAGPLIGFWLMPAILLCLLTLPFGLFTYSLQLLGWGVGILNLITAEVAALPNSLLHVANLPFAGFIAIVTGGFWLCVWRQKWRHLGWILIVSGTSSMFFISEPDIVIAPNGAAIAVKNAEGKMVLVTPKVDSWLRKIWSENFTLQTDEIKAQPSTLKIDKNGSVWWQKQKLNLCAGGYIYGGNKPEFEPMWNCNEHRPWN